MNPPLWRWLVRRRVLVANLGLVVVLLLGSGYLAQHVLRWSPVADDYTVVVELQNSGGLRAGDDVSFRGSRIGRVAAVRAAGDGVEATAEIPRSVRIPAGGTVAVGRLSAAGEQYLDFRPESESGPYLDDGAVVARPQTSTPVPVQSVLANLSGLIGGIDPNRLDVVITELDKALAGGPDRLRNVISGISMITQGLTEMLPRTEQLIANLEVIAGTTQHAQPDLSALTAAGSTVFEQVAAADAEIRRLLDQAPGQLAVSRDFLAQNQDPMTRLITNFVAITKAAKLRQPAIEALFPALRAGSAAVGIPAHDNAFNTFVDIWPRPTCDYPTVPVVPTLATTDTRVRLYNYCATDDPALQVRGAANAPRPDVPDNGATAPPGVTGDELSDPAPR